MIEILDWGGTVLILIAAFIFTTKRAAIPKVRLAAICFYIGSGGFWIPYGIIIGIANVSYGFLLTQIILLAINLKGIYNCTKEMKGN